MATTTLSSAKLKKVLAALEANWQAEMEGYYTYKTLADRDNDPVRNRRRFRLAMMVASQELPHGKQVVTVI